MKPKKAIYGIQELDKIRVSDAAKFTTQHWTDSAGNNHARVKVVDDTDTWVIESGEGTATQITKYSTTTHH